jgi:hypothetical protein
MTLSKSTIASLVSEAIEDETFKIEGLSLVDADAVANYVRRNLNINEETNQYYYFATKSMGYTGQDALEADDMYDVTIERTEFFE